MSTDVQVLFTPYSDGARPVRLFEDVSGGRRWEVSSTDGTTTYTSATALMIALTGHPEGRHWSPDRYFQLGDYARRQPPGKADLFDIFDTTRTPIICDSPLAPSIPALHDLSPKLSIPKVSRLSGKVSVRDQNFGRSKLSIVEVSGPVGIDLVNRSGEVAKLLFACFGRRIRSGGYDGDDVLQEVYRGLLARNAGKCPWDPSKSSFGHYVYMVCSCVLSNYHRKQKRRRQFEQVGMRAYQADGEYKLGDVASNDIIAAKATSEHEHQELMEAQDDLVNFMLLPPRSTEALLAVDVLPYVREGIARANIAAELGISMAAVSRAVSYLRRASIAWRQSLH